MTQRVTRAAASRAALEAVPGPKQSSTFVQLKSTRNPIGQEEKIATRRSNKEKGKMVGVDDEATLMTPKTMRKRRRDSVKSEDGPSARSKTKRPKISENGGLKKSLGHGDDIVPDATTFENATKKTRKNNYGLTPGQTPYPNWPHPTPEECEEVVRLLTSVHGRVQPPAKVPQPSLTTSGCGEVPSVLDALIRTRLSAATSDKNSSRAFSGLVKRFGILKSGVGKGSVDWNAVRLADTKAIYEAIKSGGLADVKSKDIKKILQMVWEENQARSRALKESSNPRGAVNETAEEKTTQIERAEGNVLSLDHLHLLSSDDAFKELTKFPGIGPKTASCVLLFCMQRPSFAVDTHVFRLCKWLGWVPPPGHPAGLAPGARGPFGGPTRNSTYAHCDARIPDQLKYPLHKLLIKHGRTCPRCRAITGEGSGGWEKGCVLEHLVTRTGGKKRATAKSEEDIKSEKKDQD